MAKFFAQQFVWSPAGLSVFGSILQRNTREEIIDAVENNPTQIHPWLIFQKTDEGNQCIPIMYVNIKETKWIDLK